jgi:SRSO17 transposase
MASLIDARLYLPEHWANEPVRCEKAVIPKDAQCYQSKRALALVMLKVTLQRGIRFGGVAAS